MSDPKSSDPDNNVLASLSLESISEQLDLSTLSPEFLGLNTVAVTPITSYSSPILGAWNNDQIIADVGASGKLKLQGKDADIEINGISLTETLNTIQQRLNMLVPNPELESEWQQLRELADQYRKLEQQCLEKSRMWDTLNKMPPLKPL